MYGQERYARLSHHWQRKFSVALAQREIESNRQDMWRKHEYCRDGPVYVRIRSKLCRLHTSRWRNASKISSIVTLFKSEYACFINVNVSNLSGKAKYEVYGTSLEIWKPP